MHRKLADGWPAGNRNESSFQLTMRIGARSDDRIEDMTEYEERRDSSLYVGLRRHNTSSLEMYVSFERSRNFRY